MPRFELADYFPCQQDTVHGRAASAPRKVPHAQGMFPAPHDVHSFISQDVRQRGHHGPFPEYLFRSLHGAGNLFETFLRQDYETHKDLQGFFD